MKYATINSAGTVEIRKDSNVGFLKATENLKKGARSPDDPVMKAKLNAHLATKKI